MYITHIYLILKSCDLKFVMHVVKTLFYFMKPAVYTYFMIFYKSLKRVGSVLSRSELDPFLYIWYHIVRTQIGLSPCVLNIDTCRQKYTQFNPPPLCPSVLITRNIRIPFLYPKSQTLGVIKQSS